MKRQKRQAETRNFSRGYQSGALGRSRSSCPHDEGSARQTWLSGWREGREDHWSGFNAQAQAEKLQSIPLRFSA